MTHEQAIVALFADWEAGRIDAILPRVTADATWHFSAATKPPAIGRPAIAAFLHGYAAIASASRITLVRAVERDDTLFFEAFDRFRANGHEAVVPYAGIVTFRDGLIADWRDYFDRGLIDRQIAGEAGLPDFARTLLAPPGA